MTTKLCVGKSLNSKSNNERNVMDKPTTTASGFTAEPANTQYAFPMVGTVVTEARMMQQPKMTSFVQTGMTLRDYFAGEALPLYVYIVGRIDPNTMDERLIAQWSYKLADAMIAERSKVKS